MVCVKITPCWRKRQKSAERESWGYLWCGQRTPGLQVWNPWMWTHKTKTMCITPQEVNNKICQDLKNKMGKWFYWIRKKKKEHHCMWAKKYKQGRFGLGWSNDNGSSEEAIEEKINTKKGKKWQFARAEEKLRDHSGRGGDPGCHVLT